MSKKPKEFKLTTPLGDENKQGRKMTNTNNSMSIRNED
jgi:hypothetical protein